jgi:hypothetical protein
MDGVGFFRVVVGIAVMAVSLLAALQLPLTHETLPLRDAFLSGMALPICMAAFTFGAMLVSSVTAPPRATLCTAIRVIALAFAVGGAAIAASCCVGVGESAPELLTAIPWLFRLLTLIAIPALIFVGGLYLWVASNLS